MTTTDRQRPDVPDVLKKIIARKHEEVADDAARRPLPELRAAALDMPPARGFIQALKNAVAAQRPAVIAEIKRASPSKGLIRADFEPAAIARQYAQGGAACLSVLTDVDFFQGGNQFLIDARAAVALPVLRKDFTIAPYQVWQARAIGADCILLIVAALADSELRELNEIAHEAGLDVLIEVHDEDELAQALALAPELIGVNNRDLKTFDTTLETTFALQPKVPSGCLLVSESGIHTAQQVADLRARNVHAFLVGEAFMRAPDPGAALAAMFFAADS